jgi:uncharacterized protein
VMCSTRGAIGRVVMSLALAMLFGGSSGADEGRIKALFLGDDGHHKPVERAAEIIPALARAGIDVSYTGDLDDLEPENLGRYDCLIVYANHTRLGPERAKALVGFVEKGGGLVALHCASACFGDSPEYLALVGGRFKSHKTGVFTARIDKPDHPAMKGVSEFEAWDETYVHDNLSDDRDVLMTRVDGDRREPWTWVRTQGRGRVFYTASGHDERVFTNPGYHRLVVRGVKWAVGRPDYELVTSPFHRLPAELPNYLEGSRANPGRIADMQAPVSPSESMKHISTPGGFKVELFASEPEIVKPICIAWDSRGRAWIAETVDYPNDKHPDGEGHDKITICEDTDGDGKADKFTLFADKLSIPTSMVHANGGLIVTQAPEVLFLKDTDGDDRADVRKVLFTGFDVKDTHAGPSNLRLGIDNWVYATVGYSGFSGSVGGQPFRFRQNLFRFRADGSKLEVLTSTSNNTWGLGIDETGEVVYSTANGEHSSYLGLPNRVFETVRGWTGKGNAKMADHDKMHPLTTIRQVDHHGGFTAAAGHAIYTARQFPKSYWNRVAFVCEPTGHLVHMDLIEHNGSHLVTRDRFNLFASTDEWTAPVAAEVGPDGAVWVLDWYNFVVQHNPTPLGFKTGKGNAYETPLRDKTHARIYRVVNATSAIGKPRDLSRANLNELVEALKDDNMFWRLAAQWALVERGVQRIAPSLHQLIADPKLDAIGEAPAAVHALWAMHGLGVIQGSLVPFVVVPALKHPAPGVRRAAAAVLPKAEDSARAILDAKLLDDPDPLVRRAALLALAEMPPTDAAGPAILALLKKPENAKDRWIPSAATGAAARNDTSFLAAALKAKDNPDSVRPVVRVVAEHYARGDASGTLADLLKTLNDADPAVADVVLDGLAAGWPRGKVPSLDDPTKSGLIALLPRLGETGRLRLATLATRWGLGPAFDEALAGSRRQLVDEVADAKQPERRRIEAARQLAAMNPDRETLDGLLAEVTAKASPTLASGLLDAAGLASSPHLGAAIVARWGQLTPPLRQQAFDILLRRPEWSRALLDGLEGRAFGANDLGADQAQQLAGHPDRQIAERARKLLSQGGSLPSPDRQKVLAGLLPLAERTGDPSKGREVFAKNCAKCHKHGDLGARIGPDLTGFAVHPKDKILTEVIDPNRSVEGNYRQYTVATGDGRIYNGLLASETRTAIEIVDNEAKRHAILREDIDEILASPKSLMPEGFEKQITPDEFVDLLEFLTAKGKYFPVPLDKAATIVSTLGMFYNKESEQERLILPDWAAKTVEGVPFQMIDPQGGRVRNVIMLYAPSGSFPPGMPRSVTVPVNAPARAIHLLGGVSGWGFPASPKGTVSMIVRLRYRDGSTEDHPLRNGEHLADYIRRVDVPGSEHAFALARGQQVRYLAIRPERSDPIKEIEFVKGDDRTAPIVMAVTVESP